MLAIVLTIMNELNLTKKEISRLEKKFQEFQRTREELYIFLVSYISDYQKFRASSGKRRYLRKKYALKNPKINYLFNSGDGFYWSVRNIAIVLGRARSSITRLFNKMESSEVWQKKLAALHKTVSSESGFLIDVYHQDIFDLILDYYEEDYLRRFSQPRRFGVNPAPNINDLHKFWSYLRGYQAIQKSIQAPKKLQVRPSGRRRFKIFEAIKKFFWG
ncbi:MAG: hypothetical protein IJR94_08180 [Synergistaceae bacterium]|nr:hypothetical protein [Synergistaceae bacterium]